MKILFAAALPFLALQLSASTISSVSVDNTNSASVTSVASNALGNTMGAMVITATYTGGLTKTCNYSSSAAGCGVTNWFDLSFITSTSNTHPAVDLLLGYWDLTNFRATDMVSLSINALAGGVVFDRCFVNAAGGGIAAQDNNNSGLGECAPSGAGVGAPAVGTAGSDVGFSAEGHAILGTGSASAVYSVRTALGANAPVGDLYGTLTLNFASGFKGTDIFVAVLPAHFNFQADTDLVGGSNDPGDVPEPGTWAMFLTGLALVGTSRLRRS